jgi:hypothetical protein
LKFYQPCFAVGRESQRGPPFEPAAVERQPAAKLGSSDRYTSFERFDCLTDSTANQTTYCKPERPITKQQRKSDSSTQHHLLKSFKSIAAVIKARTAATKNVIFTSKRCGIVK